MKNLAGNDKADFTILEELHMAGIECVNNKRNNGEVPYTFTGKIGNWYFKRAWYYWVASVEDDCDGLPFDSAMKLYNLPHPNPEVKILGKVVRCGGHAGAPSPDDYGAQPIYNDVLAYECKLLGIEVQEINDKKYPKITYGEITKLCNEGKIKSPRFVNTYHIDDQIGLNEFAKLLKSLN